VFVHSTTDEELTTLDELCTTDEELSTLDELCTADEVLATLDELFTVDDELATLDELSTTDDELFTVEEEELSSAGSEPEDESPPQAAKSNAPTRKMPHIPSNVIRCFCFINAFL